MMELQSISYPLRHVLTILFMSGCVLANFQESYTAAVFEHSRRGHYINNNASGVVEANLNFYILAAEAAKEQGADLILFPEYGIFPPLNRSELKNYLEFIPNPKESNVTPCDEREVFANRTIMFTLSCMAKAYEIVVVANMGGIEHCSSEDQCPEDGDRHLNANVAFDEKGKLIARYYKERLYFEEGMDLPKEEQDPIFRTKFGKFAMFICFDILFEKMAVTSRREDIDAVLFSVLWMNSSPLDISTQFFQSFAIGNNVTLLAANNQMPGWLATGSGIFMGESGSVGDTLNPDGISKLVVATIPKSRQNVSPKFSVTAIFGNGSRDWTAVPNGKDVPEVCSYSLLGPAKDIYKDYRCKNEGINYTLVRLRKSKDELRVCNNGMCCELDYTADSMNESYYFGVYNGTNHAYNRYSWWEENCFVARCDDVNGTACATFPMTTNTVFRGLTLLANGTSQTTYPSFVGEQGKLISLHDWIYIKGQTWSFVGLIPTSGVRVLAAGIKGRPFEKDPPYIR